MDQIPVKNNGANALYVGGTCIPAGETRLLDAHRVPITLHPSPAPAEQAAPPVDAVLALLDGNVRSIVAALPALSDADLARLAAAEQAGKTRSTLVEALGEEQLRRAAAGQDGGAEAPG